MIPVIGIDPGKLEGAACLLAANGTEALAAWHWKLRKRKGGDVYEVAIQRGVVEDWDTQLDLHRVGRRIRDDIGYVPCSVYALACEGLFVPRLPAAATRRALTAKEIHVFMGKARRVHALAEAAALVYGSCLPSASTVYRPLASEWRPLVLGLAANVSSDIAEATAIRMLSGRSPVVTGLGELAKNPHVAEATFIARAGWVKQREAIQLMRATR